MKTFCGILLCCLDAPAIIKRNGIECHDFSLIVKYAHFSILLLLLLLLLQPSTAITNQLPVQLVSTQIRTTRPNCFEFIIALIMTSTNIV